MIVENELELVNGVEVFQTFDQLVFDDAQGISSVSAHAAGAVDYEDELVAFAGEAEEAGSGLASFFRSDGEAKPLEAFLGRRLFLGRFIRRLLGARRRRKRKQHRQKKTRHDHPMQASVRRGWR